MPDGRKVNATLKVGNTDLCALLDCLHEQQLQQNALAAAGRTTQQDVRNFHQIHSHRANEAIAQNQYEGFYVMDLWIPVVDFRLIGSGWIGIQQYPAFT